MDRTDHWNTVYGRKSTDQLTWYQADPRVSLELIAGVASRTASIVDVGAGASTLASRLLAWGTTDLTLVDLSESALSSAPQSVVTVVADLTCWRPERTWDVWHDRAVFHFLTSEADRASYRMALHEALPPGGHAIISTFAADGPERCSGLPVNRYSASELHDAMGADAFRLVDECRESHATPWGSQQHFQYVALQKRLVTP